MAKNLTLPVPGIPFDDNPSSPSLKISADKARPRGVFGEQPGMTPKYARNVGGREADFRETMARLFIQVGPAEYERFVNSVRANDPDSESLARVLAGTNQGAGGAMGGVGYVDFLLQSAPINIQEKFSISETLADNYVLYAFGQQAPTFSYGGTLINTKQDDQAVNMLRIYSSMIRASQLARRQKVVRLRYDSYIVTGAAVGFNMSLGSEMESAVSFNLMLVVKSLQILPNPDYALTIVDSNFAPTDMLPKLANGTTNTNVRPVRMRALPPLKMVATNPPPGSNVGGGVADVQAATTTEVSDDYDYRKAAGVTGTVDLI
jgi:hypothetical protein